MLEKMWIWARDRDDGFVVWGRETVRGWIEWNATKDSKRYGRVICTGVSKPGNWERTT